MAYGGYIKMVPNICWVLKYENTILKIKKKCQKGEEPTEELKEYVQKFLDTSDTPELKFESKMETLMESLKKFSRGEE